MCPPEAAASPNIQTVPSSPQGVLRNVGSRGLAPSARISSVLVLEGSLVGTPGSLGWGPSVGLAILRMEIDL